MKTRWALRLIHFLIVGTVYLWLASYARWEFFGEETLGAAYDSLGANLLKLDASVSPELMWYDGFDAGGKRYMYFGPFPAILRIIPNLIWPSCFGLWSRISCLFAACLIVCGVLHASRCYERSDSSQKGLVTEALLIYATAFGTPLVYLISACRIYHEAILWALCGSVWAIAIERKLRYRFQYRDAFALSTLAAVVLLSRISFALPIFAILILYALALSRGDACNNVPRLTYRIKQLLALSVPAICGLAIQFWYNKARFGSYFKAINLDNHLQPPADEIGGILNIGRIPDAFMNYWGIDLRFFSTDLPFPFRMYGTELSRPELFISWREEVISLTISSAWLTLGAAIGFVLIFRRMKWQDISVALLFLIQAICISSFYFITQRYAAEFLPILFFCFLAFLHWLEQQRSKVRALGQTTFGILVIFSCLASFSSTLYWNAFNNSTAPLYAKEIFSSFHRSGAQITEWPGEHRFLSDLLPERVEYSLKPPRMNLTVEGGQLAIRGVNFQRGIGMHANTSMTFKIPDRCAAFEALIMLSDVCLFHPEASVRFMLKDENDLMIFDSGTIRSIDRPQSVFVSIEGKKELKLILNDADDGYSYDHGNWVEAAFLMK